MLFARSLQHIKNQNWSAVIFEFVLVVLGIFLALQVDNWNENRKDKIDEQRFMARLHADIGLAEELTDRVRDRRLNLQEALNDATDILFGRSERQKLTDAECRSVRRVRQGRLGPVVPTARQRPQSRRYMVRPGSRVSAALSA